MKVSRPIQSQFTKALRVNALYDCRELLQLMYAHMWRLDEKVHSETLYHYRISCLGSARTDCGARSPSLFPATSGLLHLKTFFLHMNGNEASTGKLLVNWETVT